MKCLAAVGDFDVVNAILGGAGQFAVAFNGLDFVLLHQKLEAFGVFSDDLPFALLNRGPVQLTSVDPLDPEFLGVFQVVPEFGVE